MLQIHKITIRRAFSNENLGFGLQKVLELEEFEQAILRRLKLLQSCSDDPGHPKIKPIVLRTKQAEHRYALQTVHMGIRLPILTN